MAGGFWARSGPDQLYNWAIREGLHSAVMSSLSRAQSWPLLATAAPQEEARQTATRTAQVCKKMLLTVVGMWDATVLITPRIYGIIISIKNLIFLEFLCEKQTIDTHVGIRYDPSKFNERFCQKLVTGKNAVAHPCRDGVLSNCQIIFGHKIKSRRPNLHHENA